MSEEKRPEQHIGTPQSAIAEASGAPVAPQIKPISVNAIQKGERLRASGLLWAMPAEFGGGFMRICPATITRISTARDEHERNIRKIPKVKREFKPAQPLSGKPGTELNRYTVVLAITEWLTDAPLEADGKITWPKDLNEVELREFIADYFLPALDLMSSVPPENELNTTFLLHVMEGLEEVSRVPAQEIAAVGKDFKLGLAGSIDYSG